MPVQKIPFTKMQGIGNDYVYVNCFTQTIDNPEALAKAVSDRHFGIGSDGLVLIEPSDIADVRMRMFNADGTEAQMCGNASRCVAKYVFEHGLIKTSSFRLETKAGLRDITLQLSQDKAIGATVDMGRPVLEPVRIPVDTLWATDETCVSVPLTVDGITSPVTCVSMGNPHAVLFVEDTTSLDLPHIGPLYEHNSVFPERINTEFVRVMNRQEVVMRVWERGAGETLACGTGACAVAVACVLNDKTDRRITVHLRGGDLSIEWDENDGHVLMTGPAATVFEGVYPFTE